MLDRIKLGRAFGAALLLGAAAMPLSAMAQGTTAPPAKGATSMTPAAPASAPAMKPSAGKANRHQEVAAARTALNKDGASLKVDGKMGPKTKAALTAFQTKQNLKPTGKLDQETKAALKV